MPQGKCQLCLKHKDLRDSHFMPASVLKVLRAPGSMIKDPITITPQAAVSSSKQVKDHVLCESCEDLFSRNGETWVIRNMARSESSFPLADMVQSETPIYRDPEMEIYKGVKIPSIKTDKLAYFALSVFWRGAACRWKSVSQLPEVDLGPYEKHIRLFLLGEAEFPKNTAVVVWLWTRQPYVLATTFPMRVNQGSGYHEFRFYIPGIEFCLYTGRNIPDQARVMCCSSGADHAVSVVEKKNVALVWMAASSLKTARKSQKLTDFFSGPNPRKG